MSNILANPGSEAAALMGCSCPVVDNAYGAGLMLGFKDPIYWVNQTCPLHGDRAELEDYDVH